MGAVIRVNQKLPAEFANVLLDLWQRRNKNNRKMPNESDRRLDALLLLANDHGWTLTALAEPLGVTREWIRQRVARAKPMDGLPEIPPPPRAITPMPKPDRRLRIKPDVIDELARMQETAMLVNGATPSGDPARRVSEEFSARLAGYVAQGFTIQYLSEVLGVTHGAIRARLVRHGFRRPPKSWIGTSQAVYKGHPNFEAVA